MLHFLVDKDLFVALVLDLRGLNLSLSYGRKRLYSQYQFTQSRGWTENGRSWELRFWRFILGYVKHSPRKYASYEPLFQR